MIESGIFSSFMGQYLTLYPASVKFLAISLAKRRHVETEYILYPLPRGFLKKEDIAMYRWNALRACFESDSNVFVFVFVLGNIAKSQS